MTPVDQRLFVDRDGRGDCWPCAIATVLDLPYVDVPEFGKPTDGETERNGERQSSETSNWLEARGLKLRYVHPWELRAPDHPQRYVIGIGHTVRGTNHAVICDLAMPIEERPDDHGVPRNFMHVVHDPHPSRAGLVIQHQAFEIVPLGESR
jgi:hypothetical protein